MTLNDFTQNPPNRFHLNREPRHPPCPRRQVDGPLTRASALDPTPFRNYIEFDFTRLRLVFAEVPINPINIAIGQALEPVGVHA